MDEQSAPAKKPLTPAQIRIRKRAKDTAQEQGRDWKDLSREERQVFILSAREDMKAERGKRQAARQTPP